MTSTITQTCRLKKESSYLKYTLSAICFEPVFMFFTTLDHLFMLQHVVCCLKINDDYDNRSVSMRIVYSLKL